MGVVVVAVQVVVESTGVVEEGPEVRCPLQGKS